MMDDVSLVSTLMSVDLFQGLGVERVEAIRDAGRQRALQPGQFLTQPRCIDEHLWVFLEGRLRIETDDGVPLVEVDEPRVLGEMGILLGLARDSRVVAVEETTTLELSTADLEQLVSADHDVGQHLLGNLCRALYGRMHETNEELQALRKHQDRLRARLAELAADDPLLQD